MDDSFESKIEIEAKVESHPHRLLFDQGNRLVHAFCSINYRE